MKFVIGCDLEEFKRYYRQLAKDKEWQQTFGFTSELGSLWEKLLTENPSQLIVWRENNEIIGHTIWHETNTEEHRKDDPRDKEDRETLEKLLGGKKDFIELHEIWLKQEYRGKGYGKKFFEFFEHYIKSRGYNSIVYYADHHAALAICRKRGYNEGFLKKENWHVFHLSLNQNRP